MQAALAYTTLALVVALAVVRPTVALRFRFTPGTAAALGVAVLLVSGVLGADDVVTAARLQWQPLAALACIMILTGVVHEVGAFDRLAAAIERRARTRSAAATFTAVFAVSAVTPALLNNDAAILILTPLVVALTRRLYPRAPAVTRAFAFAVFLAPGVAPFIVSNPMNMIVAEFAGLDFNAYAQVMVPIAIAGAVVTYAVLRLVFARALRDLVPAPPATPPTTVHRHAAERPVVALLVAVFLAYPIGAMLGLEIGWVAAGGAVAALAIARAYRVAPLPKVARHVSVDILVFLWGIFLVVRALQHVGVVDWLGGLYASAAPGGAHLATVGVTSAIGSALIDNHPMSILNMLALGPASGGSSHALLAALVGGDIGPRLLPIGSLAGLLWIDLLRRSGVVVGVREFVRIGALVVVPALAGSLGLLWLVV